MLLFKNRAIIMISIIIAPLMSHSQIAFNREQRMNEMRRFVAAIGVISVDTVLIRNQKSLIPQFKTIGSGLMTYVNVKSQMTLAIVTAGHVVKFFRDKNIDPVIRVAAADTFKTTEYYGITVPLREGNNKENTYFYPESNIDLGCIIIPNRIMDNLDASNAFFQGRIKQFPINSMTIPYLDDEVIICGYPGHVEQELETRFNYTFSTFKHGFVTWTPSPNMANPDLRHITMVESNATYGNSGSPVFALNHTNTDLVGILVSGFNEMDSVFANNRSVYIPGTNSALLARRRAGVSTIENAEWVKKFLEFITKEMNKP